MQISQQRDRGVPRLIQPKRGNALVGLLGWIYAPVLAHRQALLVMNLIYFGAIGLGIAYTAFDPRLQQTLLAAVGAALVSPSSALATVGEAYLQGRLLQAIALTFGVNLVMGTMLFLTMPSLLIPFAGILLGVFRAVLWGVLFAPFGGTYDARILPHVLTILVEGEAYVIAMVGVWLWWWPVVSTPGGRWHAWWQGCRRQGRVLAAVACTLAVAAIYEALEVIYLIPRL